MYYGDKFLFQKAESLDQTMNRVYRAVQFPFYRSESLPDPLEEKCKLIEAQIKAL
jgi:hypothetical protein